MSSMSSDKSSEKSSDSKGAIKWIAAVPGKSNWLVVVLMALQSVYGSTGIFYALFMRDIVDNAVAGDKKGFITGIISIVLLIVIQIFFYVVIGRVSELARATMENRFKARLWDNILKRDYARVTATHSGEWINRMTNDTVLVANGVVEILPSLCGMIVRLVCAVAMIIFIDWRIAMIMLPAGLVVGAIAYALRRRLKRLHKDVQEKDGALRIFLHENLSSLIMIRTFSSQVKAATEAEAAMDDHKAARMRKNSFSMFTNAGFSLAMYGMYFLGLFYGGWGILMGTISYGTLMAITQLISQLQGPIVNITGIIPRIFTITASADRLMEIETYEDTYVEPAGEEAIREYYDSAFEGMGMRDVYFSYVSEGGETPRVIENLSFDVKKGEYVALTGHSGCGKSTVLKLLMNVYRPDSGMVFVREKGEGSGVNGSGAAGEAEMKGTALNLFAYVPQGNLLMSGSIRDVVRFAAPSADDARIREALKIACADEFVDELEDGLDTVLGERGSGLSEGQMQRLAVARAVCSGRPVMLLDEATSALDENTERRLLENLRTMTDKTVIIVTHRPKALEICDNVIRFSEHS
ncbi:ABC-type multidrug transport system, ATPase and permease component [Ruminococcaceae bacterium YRB3002]|nr:ABC-type multidrug transport system, ATPase and permease component [Ruminococcaceae bacterium YRB3002]